MGFLDNSSITVDAILTKVGRERLAEGKFSVASFALSDEEIDYKLYDVSHPNGSDSYGSVIENMNLLEAQPNKDGFMSHLVNESVGGVTLNVGPTEFSLDGNVPIKIAPKTIGGAAEQYSFIISNRNYVKFDDMPHAKSITAKEANLTTQQFGTPDTGTANITVMGINSGVAVDIHVSVKKTTGASGDGEGSDKNGDTSGGGGGMPAKGGEI